MKGPGYRELPNEMSQAWRSKLVFTAVEISMLPVAGGVYGAWGRIAQVALRVEGTSTFSKRYFSLRTGAHSISQRGAQVLLRT